MRSSASPDTVGRTMITQTTVRAIAAAAILVLPGALIACGSDDASQQQLEQARKQGAEQQKLKDKQAEVEKQLKTLEKQRESSSKGSSSGGSGGSSGSSSSGGSVPSGAASCGGGVSAGANTSCAFALNVASAYFQADGGDPTVSVYSPVTQRTYTMSCTGGAPTVCRGGNNAVVYIR